MAAVWVSSLGGIFIGEEGSEQCGTDGDTFSHLSALQWGVFWCFSLQSGVFLLLSGDLFFLSQLGVFSSLLVGVFSRWGFFSWWRGVFLSGEFFSFLFVGVFSQWESSGGRLQLPSVKRRSIKLVRPLLQYNIDLLCREYKYLRKCIDLLLEEKEREMVKKNKRIQMPTCN